MLHTTFALLALSLFRTGTVRDGESWLGQAEKKLYRWPQPAVVVRFEARTDLVGPAIASLKAELARKPNDDGARVIAALERLTIQGSIDTSTGKMTTEVNVPYESTDPQGQKLVDEIKKRVVSTVSGCFRSLPLNDPSFLRPGAKVTGCEEDDESIEVAIAGARNGDTMKLTLARPSLLPESIETPAFTGRYEFEESFPGRFAPVRFDLVTRDSTQSHAEYTYQKQGDLLFPATVKITARDQTATITFGSLVIERRPK